MTVPPQSNRPYRDLRTEPAPARYSHGTREGRLTVAPFRAWRGSTRPVAWGPALNAVAYVSFDTRGPREGIPPRYSGLRGARRPPASQRAPAPRPTRAHLLQLGGGGGIRTHGTVARTRHFQCRTFGHSATPPTQVNHFTRRLPAPGAPEPCAGGSGYTQSHDRTA